MRHGCSTTQAGQGSAKVNLEMGLELASVMTLAIDLLYPTSLPKQLLFFARF